MRKSVHHVQPPPAISVIAEQTNSKSTLHGQHSPVTTSSSAPETSSLCNTDTVASITTNDLEGSSSLPIDLTRSNSQSIRQSLQSTTSSSVNNSHPSSPTTKIQQSPKINPLHNPVVNSVADLTIGRSKPLSNGLNALKRRFSDNSSASPRSKRPKLDHLVNGMNGGNGPNALNGVGRGMMNLLNLHNSGGIANGMNGHCSNGVNGPHSNPLQTLQRSLLLGKQQQQQQQHRTSPTPTGSHLPDPTGIPSTKPQNNQRPVALTLQQLINYLGKGSMPPPANINNNNTNNNPPASAPIRRSSNNTIKTSQHQHNPPRSAGLVPPNHISVPSSGSTHSVSNHVTAPSLSSSGNTKRIKTLGNMTTSRAMNGMSASKQYVNNNNPIGNLNGLNVQNMISRLKQLGPKQNGKSTMSAQQILINMLAQNAKNGNNGPSLAALARSAKQYALNAGITNLSQHSNTNQTMNALNNNNGRGLSQNINSRTHNLRSMVDSKHSPPVFTVSNSNHTNSHSAASNPVNAARSNLSTSNTHRHPGANLNGRNLMTLLQTWSNQNACGLSKGVGKYLGPDTITAKYGPIPNASNHNNHSLGLNAVNPMIPKMGHHLNSIQTASTASRSLSGSQPNSLSNSRTVSPSKKKELPVNVVSLLSDDEEDDDVLRKSTTTTMNQSTDSAATSQPEMIPELYVSNIQQYASGLSKGVGSYLGPLPDGIEVMDEHKVFDPLNIGPLTSSLKNGNMESIESMDSSHSIPNHKEFEIGNVESTVIRSKSRTKKRKERRDRSRDRERQREEQQERKRKRKRSPSAASQVSTGSLISDTRSQCTTGSDESYKADCKMNGGGEVDNDSNASGHNMVTRRQRRKRTCNIDKEFDAMERRIKLQEDTVQEPVSGNAYICAYAESLHLDEMQMKKGEVFPVLRGMPRSALISYCDYYKLRHSKRSKDNRLLQIVTKHFILHNREKNGRRSIEDMERDLFWHSICHKHNNRLHSDSNDSEGTSSCSTLQEVDSVEKEEKKECLVDGTVDQHTS